ncbi:hypothetical protein SteCoe_1121 [Stentor coeruleus]|uniref:PPM-type phosphatase domain-containing protein n=1 Tax=Stentor coeruleus TaxID=5963 RepID=A0A1R2D2R5_9CILI|nr:hypothetical protein SteCoe_1121 [Stentor coeruleus]
MGLLNVSAESENQTQTKSLSIHLPAIEKKQTLALVKHRKKRSIIKNKTSIQGVISINKAFEYKKTFKKLEFSTATRIGSINKKPKKNNQDNYFGIKNGFGYNNLHIFGVFDGHGPNGHMVSKFLETQYPIILEKYISTLMTNPLKETYKKVFCKIISELDFQLKSSDIDILYSGSTLLTVFLTDTDCCCVSVGDSRALIGNFDTSWNMRVLNQEHKPSDFEEKQRIEKAGGRVECLKDDLGNPIGPIRAWGNCFKSPGLAMSRALGDTFAESFGVISEPDVNVFTLSSSDRFIVIATDGLWDSVSNQKVVELMSRFWVLGDFTSAAESLANYATISALSEGNYVDDITIITVFRTN